MKKEDFIFSIAESKGEPLSLAFTVQLSKWLQQGDEAGKIKI